MKTVKNIFYIIMIGAAGFGVFYAIYSFGNYLDDKREAKIALHRGMAEGRIIKTGLNKGSYAVADYIVGGRHYTAKDDTPADDIKIGQMFRVEYDSADPTVSTILYEYPLFDKGDIIDSTVGKVIWMDSHKLRFEYTVGGETYKKFQRYKKGFGIGEGRNFEVQYLVAKPAIALLRVDYLP